MEANLATRTTPASGQQIEEDPIPLVDLVAQHASIAPAVEKAALAVLRSGGYVGGPECEALEAEFAAFCGAEHGVSVNSGTAALHVALLALGVGEGDEVVTVSHTFVATAAAVLMTGAKPVFVDIDPQTFNLDPSRLEAALTPRTKAIIPVHLYGQPAPMDEITAIAEARGIPIIEDACQAHGARFNGRRAGSFGAVACFSFYPSKNLGSAGEGGIAVTSSDELAQRMRRLRDHGQSQRYRHEVLGYNYRLPAIQAAVLRAKLPYLDEWNQRRRAIARRYDALLQGVDVVLPQEAPSAESIYYAYVVRSPRRDELAAYLKQRGIATGVHYPIPVHKQTPFAAYSGEPGALVHTEQAAAEVLSLPMYAELTDGQVERVAAAIRSFYDEEQ